MHGVAPVDPKEHEVLPPHEDVVVYAVADPPTFEMAHRVDPDQTQMDGGESDTAEWLIPWHRHRVGGDAGFCPHRG